MTSARLSQKAGGHRGAEAGAWEGSRLVSVEGCQSGHQA